MGIKKKGLSLIEILISMAILGIITVSFLTLFSNGLTDVYKSGHRTNKTAELQSLIEELNSHICNNQNDIDTYVGGYLSAKGVQYNKVSDINSLKIKTSGKDVNYYITGLNTVSNDASTVKGYQVTIYWFVDNGTSHVEATTFIIPGGV